MLADDSPNFRIRENLPLSADHTPDEKFVFSETSSAATLEEGPKLVEHRASCGLHTRVRVVPHARKRRDRQRGNRQGDGMDPVTPHPDPLPSSPPVPFALPVAPAADSALEPTPAAPPLTPEEQMARFEQELKETDWGHQPC